jgi:hypothetical protein
LWINFQVSNLKDNEIAKQCRPGNHYKFNGMDIPKPEAWHGIKVGMDNMTYSDQNPGHKRLLIQTSFSHELVVENTKHFWKKTEWNNELFTPINLQYLIEHLLKGCLWLLYIIRQIMVSGRKKLKIKSFSGLSAHSENSVQEGRSGKVDSKMWNPESLSEYVAAPLSKQSNLRKI